MIFLPVYSLKRIVGFVAKIYQLFNDFCNLGYMNIFFYDRLHLIAVQHLFWYCVQNWQRVAAFFFSPIDPAALWAALLVLVRGTVQLSVSIPPPDQHSQDNRQ